ncbi:MotA/TolQ/ExbB proton channel family protein [Phragmitibacter flavus]|nr:MotA/TolQ/ExbB proton channel family protein [Phragmitibacter flavus]
MRHLRNILLACALVFTVSAATLYAQEEAPPAEGAEVTRTVEHKSLLDKFKEGGWVMYPLTVFSMVIVWLSTDLWMRTATNKLSPPAHVDGAKDFFRLGDYVGAYQHCKINPSPFCNNVRVGLSFIGDGQEATENAMFDEINKLNASMTTRINYLSVIGVCAPMVGLVGTVGGMMGAFSEMGTAGITNPGALAGHIGEVLMATAAGLAVAIPAFMMFYVLRNKLQGSMHQLQDITFSLFRKMPYEDLKDCHVGEEEFFAARPNWIGEEDEATTAVPV